jgi:hypothetical protein
MVSSRCCWQPQADSGAVLAGLVALVATLAGLVCWDILGMSMIMRPRAGILPVCAAASSASAASAGALVATLAGLVCWEFPSCMSMSMRHRCCTGHRYSVGAPALHWAPVRQADACADCCPCSFKVVLPHAPPFDARVSVILVSMWETRKLLVLQPPAAVLVGASVGIFRRDHHRVRRARPVPLPQMSWSCRCVPPCGAPVRQTMLLQLCFLALLFKASHRTPMCARNCQ